MKLSENLPLFIYDLANNHQGDVEHALDIIRSLGEVTRKASVNAALKFQFRQLDTFVHPKHREGSGNKHIPRFLSTCLSTEDYARLTREVEEQGMLTICTPFDEESVGVIRELGIRIIKVASCSATDTPLLQEICKAEKPVVFSTAGLKMGEIDSAVGLFESAGIDLALMHCVAIYPTPFNQLRLNQIDVLKSRFPQFPVGWSTHEAPDELRAVQIALGKGAQLFERHVGIENEKHKLNAYSSTPQQVAAWIRSFQEARDAVGGEHRAPAPEDEVLSLHSLKRGVYVRNAVAQGEPITRKDVYFAMPLEAGQLDSGTWKNELVADKDYAADAPVAGEILQSSGGMEDPQQKIFSILLQAKGMLANAKVAVAPESAVELSHHFGLDRYREFGAMLITCIERSYAKKIIILLPRQKHPYHYHKIKEETFQLLDGDLEMEIEGVAHKMKPGETILVEPGQWHKFHTLDGAIFEEVSTTIENSDSYYEEDEISAQPRSKRKTEVKGWRF